MRKIKCVLIKTLVICMIAFGTLSVSQETYAASSAVAKIGNKKYTSLDKAFEAVKKKGTITLLKNVTLQKSIRIESNKTITVNLNKHTISTKNHGRFSLTNGKVTFKNGSLRDKHPKSKYGGVSDIISVYKKGAVVLNNVNCYGHIQIGGYFYNKNNGSLRIKGGTFKPAQDSWMISNFGKLVIDKGTFQYPSSKKYYGILRTFGDCTIKGGSFTVGSDSATIITADGIDGHTAKTIISGGTYKFPRKKNGFNYGIVINENAKTTVTGGNFLTSIQIQGGRMVMKGGQVKSFKPAVWVDTLYGGKTGSFSHSGGSITEY